MHYKDEGTIFILSLLRSKDGERMITMSILQYILGDILLILGGMQLGMLIVGIINTRDKKQKMRGEEK